MVSRMRPGLRKFASFENSVGVDRQQLRRMDQDRKLRHPLLTESQGHVKSVLFREVMQGPKS